MTELALVGDIGGTNSRFGLVEPGSTRIRSVEVLKNNNFGSLEESIGAYVKMQGVSDLTAAAIAVAGPIEGETVGLTNRDWTFTRESLRKAALAANSGCSMISRRWALCCHTLKVTTSSRSAARRRQANIKIVMGPGTGSGMATWLRFPQAAGWPT
jgi:glucokinase